MQKGSLKVNYFLGQKLKEQKVSYDLIDSIKNSTKILISW